LDSFINQSLKTAFINIIIEKYLIPDDKLTDIFIQLYECDLYQSIDTLLTKYPGKINLNEVNYDKRHNLASHLFVINNERIECISPMLRVLSKYGLKISSNHSYPILLRAGNLIRYRSELDSNEAAEIFDLLLQSGADPNEFYEGETVMTHLLKKNYSNLSCIKAALEHKGTNIHLSEEKGLTPLMVVRQHPDIALSKHNQDILSLVLSKDDGRLLNRFKALYSEKPSYKFWSDDTMAAKLKSGAIVHIAQVYEHLREKWKAGKKPKSELPMKQLLEEVSLGEFSDVRKTVQNEKR
jgi:hypothetical protein